MSSRRLRPRRGDVADGREEATGVEPVDPLEGGELHGLEGAPRSAPVDDLGLVEAVDGLGQGEQDCDGMVVPQTPMKSHPGDRQVLPGRPTRQRDDTKSFVTRVKPSQAAPIAVITVADAADGSVNSPIEGEVFLSDLEPPLQVQATHHPTGSLPGSTLSSTLRTHAA